MIFALIGYNNSNQTSSSNPPKKGCGCQKNIVTKIVNKILGNQENPEQIGCSLCERKRQKKKAKKILNQSVCQIDENSKWNTNENNGECKQITQEHCEALQKQENIWNKLGFNTIEDCVQSPDMVPMLCQPNNLCLYCNAMLPIDKQITNPLYNGDIKKCIEDKNNYNNHIPEKVYECAKNSTTFDEYYECFNKI